MENQIIRHRLAVQDNIEKAFDVDFEKGRTGVYSDNTQNHRLHRVGQQYGHKKEHQESAGNYDGKKEEPTDHAKHAAGASDEALQRAAADENADEKVRNAAKEELKKRGDKDDKEKK